MIAQLNSILLLLLVCLPWISSNHHLHSFPPIRIDPTDYPKSDLLVHDFRRQFHPSYDYRCLLQTESKHFLLDSSCQLVSRTALKHVCPLNYTLRLEIVFPQNTTVYALTIELSYPNALPVKLSKSSPSVQLPFVCNGSDQLPVDPKRKEIVLGNARLRVLDEQEEKSCQFEKTPYRIKLKENEVFKKFLQVKSVGACLASHYLLASSNSKRNAEYFSLNSSTGELSLTRALDYELVPSWKLVIQADDRFHIPFYTYVIIDVEDINDCPPLLSWNFPLQTIELINDTDAFHIRIGMPESKVAQSNVIIANLIASDLDASPTSDESLQFELKFNSSSTLPFDIHGPFADSTFVLSSNEPLDREVQEIFHLHLILTDRGQPRLSSFYQLDIQIFDDNDNAPRFEQSTYSVEIEENQPSNSTLLRVHASDADQADNGRVTYELFDSNERYVRIDPQTGVIRTKISFDYEQMPNFTFNVTAIDHPKRGRTLRTTAMVVVKITDRNDNAPQFPQSTYEFSIYENNAPNTYLGQVTAKDGDHSPLTYSLAHPSAEISSLFRLSASDGKLYLLHPLDREHADHYTFHVLTSDGLHQSPAVTVRVRVLDLNDEIPRFTFPNENNDTLIIDRTYWNSHEHICQIDVQDHDQIPNHTLMLVQRLDQLKNYDYLAEQGTNFQFDSAKFFLDDQGQLFFNRSNGSTLTEGVYYLAFRIIDGQNYFDEKLLKLIVVNEYERVQAIVKEHDSLGSHLNNRLSYLQYRSRGAPSHKQRSYSTFSPTGSLDHSSKFLVFIVITVLSIILIGITFIFISLIRRKSSQQKKQESDSASSGLPSQSDSSTTNLFKPAAPASNADQRQSLRVSNCYEYNEITSPSSLLVLNKDGSMLNDHCCLLTEKDQSEEQRNKAYSSWVLSTSNRPESRYSQRSNDSSTFHSLNRLSIPSPARLAHQLCSPKRHSAENGALPSASSPTEYTVAVVSSTNNSPHTPVSSDDGFCGSSDISDPPLLTAASHSLLSHSYRQQPYNMMKESIIPKNHRSPSFTALFNADTTRRVRFNLEPEEKLQQRTILPLPTSNSPGRLADHALRRFEHLYMTRDDALDQQSIDSTILYTNSTVV